MTPSHTGCRALTGSDEQAAQVAQVTLPNHPADRFDGATDLNPFPAEYGTKNTSEASEHTWLCRSLPSPRLPLPHSREGWTPFRIWVPFYRLKTPPFR